MVPVVVALADTSCWRIAIHWRRCAAGLEVCEAESGLCCGGGRTVTAAESAVRKRPRERETETQRDGGERGGG